MARHTQTTFSALLYHCKVRHSIMTITIMCTDKHWKET